MGRPDGPAWLALAERLLGYAAAEGAGQAEVLVIAQDSALTRFANSEIHQNVAETHAQLSLRFVIGRQIGVASSDRLDDAGLHRLAETAGRIAKLTAEREDFVSLPSPGPIPTVRGAFAEGTASSTPEARAECARGVIAAADAAGVTAYGSVQTTTETVAVANSLGVRVAEDRTAAQVIVVAMGPDGGNGYAEACSVDATALDGSVIGREAAERARAAAQPAAIAAGDYPVVLDHYAVVDLCDMLGYVGFSALAVEEGRSFAEPGRTVGSELVSIWDDATDPTGLPASFDYEGVGKQRVTLVERGVCRDVVFDSDTAGRVGRRSTGHGLPAPNPYGPFPLNVYMAPGEAARDDLIGSLERGLLVTRFHYTNVIHPKLAIVTGMTRDGTFLVEGGRIVGPVRNLRFTMSYLDALAAVRAVSRERRLLRGMLGAVFVPALRLESFSFTGVTEH